MLSDLSALNCLLVRSSACRGFIAAQVYQNLGMTPYDVLFDCLSAHWIAGKSAGIVVSIPHHPLFPPRRRICFRVEG